MALSEANIVSVSTGCGAELKAVFDPTLSPRNLLISSLKSQSDKDGVEL